MGKRIFVFFRGKAGPRRVKRASETGYVTALKKAYPSETRGRKVTGLRGNCSMTAGPPDKPVPQFAGLAANLLISVYASARLHESAWHRRGQSFSACCSTPALCDEGPGRFGRVVKQALADGRLQSSANFAIRQMAV